MSDLIPSMPRPLSPPSSLPQRFHGEAFRSREDPGFPIKIRVRYLVEKLIDGQWLVMARLPDSADRIPELSEALGGLIRVQDLVTGQTLPEKDYP